MKIIQKVHTYCKQFRIILMMWTKKIKVFIKLNGKYKKYRQIIISIDFLIKLTVLQRSRRLWSISLQHFMRLCVYFCVLHRIVLLAACNLNFNIHLHHELNCSLVKQFKFIQTWLTAKI